MLLEVLNPVAQLRGSLAPRAVSPRPPSLEGRTVGLLASGRTNSDVALKRVAENLRRRYSKVTTNFYMGNKQPWPQGLIERVAQECDAVVIATAD